MERHGSAEEPAGRRRDEASRSGIVSRSRRPGRRHLPDLQRRHRSAKGKGPAAGRRWLNDQRHREPQKSPAAHPDSPGARWEREFLTARQSEMLDMAPTGAASFPKRGWSWRPTARQPAAGTGQGEPRRSALCRLHPPEDRDRFHFHLRQLLQFGLPRNGTCG